MSTDKRWGLLLAMAISAAAGAAIAFKSQRRQVRAAEHLQHKTHVKAWENEGGNLAPIPATAALP